MHSIPTYEMKPEFYPLWRAAGMHIDAQVQGGMKNWLKVTPYPPFLEHLSFRLGNQLFFVRITDADGRLEGPGNIDGLFAIADGCKGHACLMPMKKSYFGNNWKPNHSGWGLIDAKTNKTINPVELVSEEQIEMTDWELQDFAVQIVRDRLELEGYELMSWQSNPEVDPSLWFIGESKKPEWVIIRFVRFPQLEATIPQNIDRIAEHTAKLGEIGHFASVGIANADDAFAPDQIPAMPLYRGHAMTIRYLGLERIPK